MGTAADLDGARAIDELVQFVTFNPERHGNGPLMQNARVHLEERLASFGYDVHRHTYTGVGGGGVNIVGVLRGTERPHDWVTVTAHYDTVQATEFSIGSTLQGAWDNGAGVAAALEIARVAAQREWRHTIAIVFFDDEELGLIGSWQFVSAYKGKAWEGGNIRLTANVNMDPPGLNWPCMVEGVYLPITMFQAGQGGQGQSLMRQFAEAARDAQGVPREAKQFFYGGARVGILSGASDNVEFYRAGVPEIYVGSSTHLHAGGASVSQFMYPLHTPADNVATMFAYCAPPILEQGFEVAMRTVYGVLVGIEGHPGAFPAP